MERTNIENYIKLIWILNDTVGSSQYTKEEKDYLLNRLFHILIDMNKIEKYLIDLCEQCRCFDINDFIRFLHDEYGTILRPAIIEDHTKNEVFTALDQEFLLGFFLGLNEDSHHQSRYRINSGIIKGWKQIKGLSVR